MMKMNFFKSFKYAFSGTIKAFLTGRNFRIMLVCFVLVVAFGFLFNVSAMEWIVLIICSGMVLSLELLNTAIEKTIDLIVSDYNKTAGNVKDIAAGAVLIASIFSAIIALIIFIPYIINIPDCLGRAYVMV